VILPDLRSAFWGLEKGAFFLCVCVAKQQQQQQKKKCRLRERKKENNQKKKRKQKGKKGSRKKREFQTERIKKKRNNGKRKLQKKTDQLFIRLFSKAQQPLFFFQDLSQSQGSIVCWPVFVCFSSFSLKRKHLFFFSTRFFPSHFCFSLCLQKLKEKKEKILFFFFLSFNDSFRETKKNFFFFFDSSQVRPGAAQQSTALADSESFQALSHTVCAKKLFF
jgi:hypothetical protein